TGTLLCLPNALTFAKRAARSAADSPFSQRRTGGGSGPKGAGMDASLFPRATEGPSEKPRNPGAHPQGAVCRGGFLLLRASCPSPFGPASPFKRVPDAFVVRFLLAAKENERAPERARYRRQAKQSK